MKTFKFKMTFQVINCNKTCQREQIFTTLLTCKIPCEQFLNNFILKFYEGGGKLEKSHLFVED